MNESSLTKLIDVQGLSLALAKTKADYDGQIPAPDWETSYGKNHIANQPSIKAGTGTNSIVEGYVDATVNVTFTIYVTGDAGATEYTYTTEDSLPDSSELSKFGVCHDIRYSNTFAKIISCSNGNLVVRPTLNSSDSLNNTTVYIYYNYSSMANGEASHAEGNSYAYGNYSHAEGEWTFAKDVADHAEGQKTVSSGGFSHSEGYSTWAKSLYSHAEGNKSIASGTAAHGEGYNTIASGKYSHAEGRSTIAASQVQHAEGKWNVEDSANTYAHIVGNGTANGARSNAYTLDWNGNGWYAGKLTVGAAPTADMDVATKAYVDSQTSDGNGIMVVNFTQYYDESIGFYSWQCDKTFTEIYTHLSNGGYAYSIATDLDNGVHIGSLKNFNSNQVVFTSATNRYNDDVYWFAFSIDATGWATGDEISISIPTAMSSLSDVAITNPLGEQILIYDYTSSKWVNSNGVFVPRENGGMLVNNDGDNNGFIVEYDENSLIMAKSDGVRIHNVVTPTANGDAANKQYVDESVGSIHDPLLVTITGNDTNGYTADVLYSDLRTAHLQGRPIFLKYSDSTMVWYAHAGPATSSSTTLFTFGTLTGGASYYWTISSSNAVTKPTLRNVSSVNGQTGIVTLAIPEKTSDLTNDSGFVTTDTNTTYTLSMTNNVITLTGSDGSTSSVTLSVYDGSVSSS